MPPAEQCRPFSRHRYTLPKPRAPRLQQSRRRLVGEQALGAIPRVPWRRPPPVRGETGRDGIVFASMTGVCSLAAQKGGVRMSTPASRPATSKDPIAVDPKHYTVEFENEKVRVLRIKYGPHEKSQMHGHPSSIGVMLTDFHSRFTYPDGSAEDVNGQAG